MKIYTKKEIRAALAKLTRILSKGPKGGLPLASILAKARNRAENDALRMVFTLATELKRLDTSLKAVENVEYKRLKGGKHKIRITWATIADDLSSHLN